MLESTLSVKRRRWNLWPVLAGAIALVVVAPILSLIVTAAAGSEGLWSHMFANVLPTATRNTAILLTGVGVLTAVIGTGTAWLVTAYQFPGRRIFDWALLLPLAVPTYIIAYAYLDVLHPVGPVQTLIREMLGYSSPREFRLPDIRSMTGCILLLSFVLYPYVYLTTRAMFMMQTANLIDIARTLGTSRFGVFFRVALPLARPAVVVGMMLALLEALNDIGAAEFLGVRTLTVAVYNTFAINYNLAGAAQLALAMLGIIVALVLLERWGRRQRRYANDAQHPRPLPRHRLRFAGSLGAIVACALPILLGFVVPATYLLDESIQRIRFNLDMGRALLPGNILQETLNTLTVSGIATLFAVIFAVLVGYAARIGSGTTGTLLNRASSLGYAVPGTVLAIGALPIINGIHHGVHAASMNFFGVSAGLFLTASGAAIVYAYVVRFLAVSAGSVEAGFNRISPSIDAAARTLGQSRGSTLWRVHLPLMRPAIAAGALLVFVDCMKELPATLLLRPPGFETLATHLYGEAIRGTYEDAAIAALLIVAAGLIPVIVLTRIRLRAGTDSH